MKSVLEKKWITNAGNVACVVVAYNGVTGRASHRCGYVAIKRGSEAFRKHYSELMNIDAHGGLTFSEATLKLCDLDDVWWIGFDCMHNGDRVIDPGPQDVVFPDDKVRSLEYCIYQCEHIAQQVAYEDADARWERSNGGQS